MEVSYNGSSNGQSFSSLTSYSTVYTSASTIKVNVSYSSAGTNASYLVWIQKSGTVLAADFSGYNITGSQAQGIVTGIFSGFFIMNTQSQVYSSLLSSSYFRSAGTSQVTLGPTTMTVTNYVAANTPETFTDCNGDTTTLQTFALSAGTPSGTSYSLLTYLNESGSTTSSGQTNTFDFTLKIVSLTTA